jgi:aminobenzoyl-glutamate transport protein
MTDSAPAPRRSVLQRFLAVIERVGNALPHPATLFASLALLVLVGSAIAYASGVEVLHPGTGKALRPENLLSVAGLHRILTGMVTNFTNFAPLGTVLVAMLGIGVAEGTGLIGAALRLLVLAAPRRALTFVLVLAGVLSNTASEVGYVLLVPLAAIIFLAVGRHPVAGMAAAFAGVSGGYSANLLLGTIDPLLSGLSEEAARIVLPGYAINPACNYYFMAASTFIIAGVGTWVTEAIVSPRLGPYVPPVGEKQEEHAALKGLEPHEKRGLLFAGVTAAVCGALLLWGTLPENGFLRDPATGSLLKSPFMSGIVTLIFLLGVVVGAAYGIGARTVKNDADLIRGMSKSMETLGSYLVLVFFAAQFVAWFNWSNLGLIVAVKGADGLRALGLGPIPLMIAFVLLSAALNLVMGSASAKWAIMAPIFIPMFMLLGYTPELVQAAYRIGDSVTNIISPMMSYFALIIAFVQRYDKKAGIGTIVATMLPYTFAFLIVWTVMLVVWLVLDLPLGPGARMFLPTP